ncbi:GTP-binding protein Obg/CgtA [Tothia fuscella]|uniref:GTP-binding protein Obg/CgtA n=1 Tax=Tothia fuscella TaxID=1048955 RepID=A0A9P4NWC2_9PEZI|nr:GTP-binding protein Obg/CgtA [Tothia fuscella]
MQGSVSSSKNHMVNFLDPIFSNCNKERFEVCIETLFVKEVTWVSNDSVWRDFRIGFRQPFSRFVKLGLIRARYDDGSSLLQTSFHNAEAYARSASKDQNAFVLELVDVLVVGHVGNVRKVGWYVITALRPLRKSLTPFLYPFTTSEILSASRFAFHFELRPAPSRCIRRNNTTTTSTTTSPPTLDEAQLSHLNPTPDNYSLTPFTDRCTLVLHAGSGGHGCVSFLREKFIAHGPPNGGDGGIGGNIYIQAVRGETSLHKISRRRELKAGRGKNGQGSSKGGQRGQDILLQVPIGTVVREISRHDPVTVEEELFWEETRALRMQTGEERGNDTIPGAKRRDKWLLHPSAELSLLHTGRLPELPRPRRSNVSAMCPDAPIHLDLDEHMENPILLAAGAMGGLGNPHFTNKDYTRPKFATKGDGGMKLIVHMELKLLADVGLVGLPNAGKSTLLRALSNSRARVGNWAFTTLQPNIGTVVLDDFKGRSKLQKLGRKSERTRFTIADIPGLIQDAHLDKGLGLGFLRHIERAAVLAFVVDLSAGDAVAAVKSLWKEVSAYESLRSKELNDETRKIVDWTPPAPHAPKVYEMDEFGELIIPENELPLLVMPPISAKPWIVVATKADLEGTRENFEGLRGYLEGVLKGTEEHPSGKENGWRRQVQVLPVSAIRGEGVERLPEVVLDLLE